MSMFGDSRNHMNYLYDELKEFFENGGTLKELFEVLKYVEQLEKENIKQKEIIENLTTMTVCGDKKQIKNTAQYKLEQLENIRKEAIEECKSVIGNPEHAIVSKNELMKIMLNILNKGEINNELD